ncbi:cell division protein ZapA [Litorivicinus lipolyticus]|jgi:cell division protein ZapA|uniref:Cell division protein ZapA n=1 Tax=Litorivicinus lipolyticus TaxID=418701 RepID=A0A5Q2QBU8_9GAMM|nr:cell division protein ZapA [Litorivicinus lipolyticus]QGG79300.1 cell division protein ZapA [Litorivicinus lipolyticus]
MSDKQTISVRIAGKDHKLSCEPQDAASLAAAAQAVDMRVEKLRASSSQITSERAMALAALDIAFEYAKLTQSGHSHSTVDAGRIEKLNQRLDQAIESIQGALDV